jgi:drug/metabolite transporter (DMT)-like permease
MSAPPFIRPPESPALAALFIVCCAALVAMTTLLAKLLGRGVIDGVELHPLQISAGRFLFAWLALLPVVAWHRPSFKGVAWRLQTMRSLCGWGGVSCMFAAATLMPLADATAISFLNPMVAMVLAIPLLGERVGPWRWGAAVTALAGTWLLIRPGTDSFQAVALVALAAAVFMGLEAILVKMLTGADRPLRILFVNNSIGAVLALGAASFVWVPPTPMQWLGLAGVGVVMVSAQTFFIQGLRRANASFALPFIYATLVFAALYDYLTFRVVPAPLSLAGAALIVAGALVLAWRETLARRRRAEAA